MGNMETERFEDRFFGKCIGYGKVWRKRRPASCSSFSSARTSSTSLSAYFPLKWAFVSSGLFPSIEPQDIINHLIDDMDGAAIDVKDHIVVI